jgi:DNA primase
MSIYDDIKERIDLVDLIGKSVSLKRSGTYWKALCPFHQETIPSFYVRDRHWTCFGCQKHGDAFDWLVEHEHYSFPDALRSLAERAGIQLDNEYALKQKREKHMLGVLALAQRFYSQQLTGIRGQNALAYLRERGLNDETIQKFGIGYASSGSRLRAHLSLQGVSDQDMHEAGLTVQRISEIPGDFLFDRIVFPIRNMSGSTIAFGGRALSQQSQIKYINTRDTLVFHKHDALYAMEAARASINERGQVVVVEGYMDVITAHQHGHTNVVATLGTAVTESQLRRLSQVSKEIVLALDPDKAGQAATWRSLQRAERSLRTGDARIVGPRTAEQQSAHRHGSSLRVAVLPDGHDPDDLIRTSGPDQWESLIGAALPVVDFALKRISSRSGLDTADSKASAADEIASVLVWVSNPVARAHYVQRAAEILDIDEQPIEQLVKSKISSDPVPTPEPRREAGDDLDEYALALLRSLQLGPDGVPFARPESKALACLTEDKPDELSELSDRVDARVRQLSMRSEGELHTELHRTIALLHRQRLFLRRGTLLQLILDTDDATERAALSEKLDVVSDAIKQSDALLTVSSASGSMPDMTSLAQ